MIDEVWSDIMSHHLKGKQLQMLFDKADTTALFSSIFNMGFVAYRTVVNSENDKKQLSKIDQIVNESGHFGLVPKDKAEIATWKTVKSKSGGENFHFDYINSKAVQILACEQSVKRIGLGRISLSTEWVDDIGKVHSANYEKEVFKTLQKLIKNYSEGKIGAIYVGKIAYSKWNDNDIELCYTPNENGICFTKEGFKQL